MLATLERPGAKHNLHDATDEEELGRAVMGSLVSGTGSTFTVDVADIGAVNRVMTQIRSWLLVARAGTGGVSATVAPQFLEDTYPAMLALTRRLNDAGAGGLWHPDGARTLRLGEAKHIFVSADRPVTDHSPAPDALLEVVQAHRIDGEWFAERVAPRARRRGLTRVFYGAPGTEDSVYERARRGSLALESHDGFHRHFSLMKSADPLHLPNAIPGR
ncbi:MAG: hypothetical protein WD208_03045 [Dehalococcoidia bacterium]